VDADMAKTLLKTRTFDELKIGNVARLIRYLERDATHCHRAAARELSLPKDIVNVEGGAIVRGASDRRNRSRPSGQGEGVSLRIGPEEHLSKRRHCYELYHEPQRPV
jgi:hypothetical protein